MTILQIIFCGVTTTLPVTQFTYLPYHSFAYTAADTHVAWRCLAGNFGLGTPAGIAMQAVGCAQDTIALRGFES